MDTDQAGLEYLGMTSKQNSALPLYCPSLKNIKCRILKSYYLRALFDVVRLRRFHSLETVTICQPDACHAFLDPEYQELRGYFQLMKQITEIELKIELGSSMQCHNTVYPLRITQNLYYPWWLDYGPNPVGLPDRSRTDS
ncbi:hypothetical protein FRC02_007125 [Tulasnella sp. 418]|nr:hypothetical protein FRC02_007125 [Tulasnella sp. 418]